jgi:hypothetical protein
MYSSQMLSMSTVLLKKNSGEANRTTTRPPVPYTNTSINANNVMKDKCNSPTSDQRSGQEIRQKLTTYFEKSKSSLDATEPRPKLKSAET